VKASSRSSSGMPFAESKDSHGDKHKQPSSNSHGMQRKNIDKLLDNLPSAQKAQSTAASTAALLKSTQRIRDLEAEVFDLQKKLDRSLSRLHQQPGSADALSRETELENELAVSAEKSSKQRNANRSLELTVKQLQSRLTQAEADKLVGRDSADGTNSGGADGHGDGSDALKHANRSRERELEEALIKSKQEKDRAVRVLITVLGKQRVAEFLAKHAGAPDILDTLCAHFSSGINTNDVAVADGDTDAGVGMGDLDGESTRGSNKRTPNNKKQAKKTTVPALGAGRSRSDEMYSMNSMW